MREGFEGGSPMAGRRRWIGLVLLAAALHGLGMAREPLPAQDGLKFIRVARQFQSRPWADVVRDSDQHPLYPALIALAEPAVRLALGPGPDAWRVAAQGVSALAAIAMLVPLCGFARALFGDRAAYLGTFAWLLLPLPVEVGHDTLGDSLALLAFMTAIRLGEVALRAGSKAAAIGCGAAAGIGYLVRPEVAAVPIALGLATASRWLAIRPTPAELGRLAAAGLALLVPIGGYAVIKGELSEKLAIRFASGLDSSPRPVRTVAQTTPRGLDDPRWDFSAKEESGGDALQGRPATSVARIAGCWAEGLGYALVPLVCYGVARAGSTGPGGRLAAAYVACFVPILARHASTLGYLSGRHTLTLVAVSLPWAAAGYAAFSRDLAVRFAWDGAHVGRRRALTALLALGFAIGVHAIKPGHPTRWGHLAAGRWLRDHAAPGEAVLDTRGWARFVADRPGYDYWHVRQALTDSKLAHVVVGADELEADSPRGATLRAILTHAAEPLAAFPSREGGRDDAVWIFRYRQPSTWEGLDP